jgi:hypothetical protein
MSSLTTNGVRRSNPCHAVLFTQNSGSQVVPDGQLVIE